MSNLNNKYPELNTNSVITIRLKDPFVGDKYKNESAPQWESFEIIKYDGKFVLTNTGLTMSVGSLKESCTLVEEKLVENKCDWVLLE